MDYQRRQEACRGMKFAENLKKIRLSRGMTMAMLEEKTGIANPTVYNYEHGKRIPNASTIEKLCIALQCTATELLGF